MKKALSLFLVVLMLVGMLPMTAINAFAAVGEYELVTDASQLSVGAKVIIAAKDYDFAMSTTQNGNNRGQTAITKGSDVLSSPSTSVQVLTLEAGNISGTYAFNTGSGYLYVVNNSSNYLKTQADMNDAASFNITVNADGTANVTSAAFVSGTAGIGNVPMQYNQSSGLFSCYPKGTQKALALYVLNEGSGDCDHAGATVSTVDPTCTEAGSKTVTCSCGYTNTSAIAALGHAWGDWSVVTDATCTEVGSQTRTCATCSTTENGEIAAKGHSYADGKCSVCGVDAPEAIAYLINSAEEFVSGEYVMVVSSGYAMGHYESGWILPAQPAVSDDGIIDAAGSIWTLTVDGNSVKIADANGVTVAPKGGNANGIIEGDYSWTWSVNEDGTFAFAGVEDDTVTLASNVDATNGLNRFRGYKNSTIASDTKNTYLTGFSLYKVGSGSDEPACQHPNATTVTVDATCTVAGSKTTTCPDCQKVTVTEIAALGHNVVDGACTRCDFEGEIDEPDPSESVCAHANTTTTTVEATCTTAGSVTVTCDDCGETISNEEIPAAHKLAEGTCTLCYKVVEPKVDTPYKFGMIQGKVSATDVYYLAGGMDGHYMATTNVRANAINVYLETAEGGYYLYTYVDNVKTYINMVVNGTYVNGAYEAAASTVYTYNAEESTVNATVNNTLYEFGTRNDKSYTTVGPCKTSYDNFFCQFYNYGEIQLSAADGAAQLESDIKITYNGIDLPATVTVSEKAMNVAWTVEASDANAAKVVDGKLVIAPQAAAATYTLTATVSYNGTTATASWTGNVVPASTVDFEEGEFVIWVDGKAITTLESGYGYLAAVDVALTDNVLTGYADANVFVLSANGDGTYAIEDANGNYLYSDMSYASSTQFNVGEAPVSGKTWTVVAADNGYYIYNVDRAGAIGFNASYGNFGLYKGEEDKSVLTLTEIAACDHSEEKCTTTTVEASCTTNGSVTVTCECGYTVSVEVIPATGHTFTDNACSCGATVAEYYIAAIREADTSYSYMTSNLTTTSTQRYASVNSELAELPEAITDPVDSNVFYVIKNADGTYNIAVAGGKYLGWTSGNSGALVDAGDALTLTLTENDDGTYLITFVVSETETRNLALNEDAQYQYFAWYKTAQINSLHLIPVEEACKHANTTTTTVDATCTEDGSITVTCKDCGETISTETITSNGHSFEEGKCTVCGAEDPNYVPAGPTFDANLVFTQTGLSFQEFIGIQPAMKYTVASGYDRVYIEVTHVTWDRNIGDFATVTEEIEGSRYLTSNVFRFTKKIMAWGMTEAVSITLYAEKDGVLYVGQSVDTSVTALAVEKIAQYEAAGKATACTALANMLKYGAAVQTQYSHNSENLPTAQLGAYSKYVTTAAPTITASNSNTGSGIKVNLNSVSMQAQVEIQFGFKNTVDLTGYEIRYTVDGVTETIPVEEFGTVGSYNVAKIAIKASNMRKNYTVALYDSATGKPASAVYTVSVEAYAKAKVSSAQELIYALMNYGDAIAAL